MNKDTTSQDSLSSGHFLRFYELQPKEEFHAKGSFSTCRKCRHRSTLREYAVKIMTEDDYHENELRLLRKCQGHSNIVELKETLKDSKTIYLVMEFLSGGDLFDVVVEPFTEKKSRKIMRQLGSAIEFIHSKDVVHRDIKPENITFIYSGADSPVKIVDFGLSLQKQKCTPLKSPFFSLPYAAPEIVALEKYNESCDLWSLGSILYFILSAEKAFPYGESISEALRIKSGMTKYDEQVIHNVSDSCKQVLNGLLNVDPEKRLTATELVNHSWLAIEN